jgi:EmrB/QacA subfamily drug resistance transporter
MMGQKKWLALGAFVSAALVVGFDATILAVALPTLARELSASATQLQWFSTSFMLAMAAAMLPVGVLADHVGRKKVLLGALIVFGVCSAACAYSVNPEQLIAARTVMGVAGGAIGVLAMAMMPVLFDEAERPRAIGIFMAATFVGMPLGPILGGWLLTRHWWGWVFLINVPVALLAAVGTALLVPETRPERPGRVDLMGMLWFVGGLSAVIWGFVAAGSDGWDSRTAWAWIGGGLVVLLMLVAWERHLAVLRLEPVIPPELFSVPGYTPGTVVPALGVLAMTGLLFAVPMYAQAILGLDALGAGVRLLSLVGGMVISSVLAARLASLLGPRVVAAAGYALVSVGAVLGARTTVDSTDGYLMVWMGVVGLGLGLGMSTSASVAMSHVTPDQASTGSAVFTALQKTGNPLGVAILGSVLNRAYIDHLDLPAALPSSAVDTVRLGVFQGLGVADKIPSIGATVRESFVHALGMSMWVSAGITAGIALIALIALPGKQRAVRAAATSPSPAHRQAEDLSGRTELRPAGGAAVAAASSPATPALAGGTGAPAGDGRSPIDDTALRLLQAIRSETDRLTDQADPAERQQSLVRLADTFVVVSRQLEEAHSG